MFGGLKKSASRLALVAAAGVLSTGAYAADLGGDCCADLEERVAELEATTVRKGNRKMSVTLSGQVNRMIMNWNDGIRSGTIWGIDNTNSSTRFNLSGAAKISPTVSAGFNIVVEWAGGGRSVAVRQNNEDGAYLWGNAANGSGSGDGYLAMREASWYLDSAQVGRLTMGRITNESHVYVQAVDLGGIAVVAGAGGDLIGGSFTTVAAGTVDANNVYTTAGRGDLGNYFMDKAAPALRMDGLKYTTPTFGGFVAAASIGERDGQQWGVSLKYAGEFSGVRIAAGIGHERVNDCGSPIRAFATTTPPVAATDDDICGNGSKFQYTGGALALRHVPTGLFAQGAYLKRTGQDLTGADTVDGTNWTVQAGIAQNFFGVGQTSLYGEYMRANGFVESLAGTTTVGLGKSQGTMWGLGVVQVLDAATTDLYLGYRRFSTEDNAVKNENIGIISAGARVRF